MNKSIKKVYCITVSGLLIFCLIINFGAVNSANVYAAAPQDHAILNEGFETGTPDPRILIDPVGTFNSLPAIRTISNFGSARAFGFGRSTCPASCFDNFVTTLRFTLPTPTFISYIRFKEMELFDNWGSQGQVFLDGVLLPNSDFGRTPVNNRTPDTMFRTRKFLINRSVRIIELKVRDITNLSEIFIDDLVIASKADNINSDFDGDFKTDLSIFRPSNGQWWYQQSSDNVVNAFAFGISIDKIVPADYDGDGKTDVAFFRPLTGEWFVLRSSNLTFFAAPFGYGTDIPAPGDFDGDGRADFAVYRGSQGTWYILNTTGGVQITPFGTSGDIPTVADYDGDGKTDIAIYRPSGSSGNGEWWIQRSTAGLFATVFGTSTDKPVQGDYTGDGKADVAFWRPSNGNWFVLRSEDLSFYAAPFGANGDIPAPGDYDGDGKFDLAVFRPNGATWFVLKSSGGTLIQGFGLTGDIPAPSAYVP